MRVSEVCDGSIAKKLYRRNNNNGQDQSEEQGEVRDSRRSEKCKFCSRGETAAAAMLIAPSTAEELAVSIHTASSSTKSAALGRCMVRDLGGKKDNKERKTGKHQYNQKTKERWKNKPDLGI